MPFIKTCRLAATCMLPLLCSLGCTNDAAPKVSTDLIALRKIVNLDIAATSAKWEMFGTPEDTGGVPGPTDYVTLIAELAPVDDKITAASAPLGSFWLVPGSARPWLSDTFRTMLEKQDNTALYMSKQTHCRDLRATLQQTGKPVQGFACTSAEKTLVYLTVADYSET